jgi:hypothetical protein
MLVLVQNKVVLSFNEKPSDPHLESLVFFIREPLETNIKFFLGKGLGEQAIVVPKQC